MIMMIMKMKMSKKQNVKVMRLVIAAGVKFVL
jgi:hypothetical protein